MRELIYTYIYIYIIDIHVMHVYICVYIYMCMFFVHTLGSLRPSNEGQRREAPLPKDDREPGLHPVVCIVVEPQEEASRRLFSVELPCDT